MEEKDRRGLNMLRNYGQRKEITLLFAQIENNEGIIITLLKKNRRTHFAATLLKYGGFFI